MTAKSRALSKARQRRSPNTRRQPARRGNVELQPRLIYLRMRKTEFDTLQRLDTLPSQEIYRRYYRFEISPYDVIIGLMLFGNGKFCYTEHPVQYKFENNGIAHLEIIGHEIL